MSLISVDEHLERILAAIQPLPPYQQPLVEALGLPACETITAPVDLPLFDNAAVDGYAVVCADLADASPGGATALPVVGEAAAGQTRLLAMSPGTAVRITSGAPVPKGADAIVPLEWTDGGVATVRVERSPEPGQYIRHRGEDVREGQVVLEDGRIVGPRQVGLLASVGRPQVAARPRPRVVVMSTGSELREPGTALGHDAIYDSNSFMLAAAVRAAGAIAYRVSLTSDDPQEFRDALSDQLVRADLVVTSGGLSAGAYEVVKEVLGPLGTVQFDSVAMEPGQPQGFGHVGEDATPIFTLPGNPVAAYVSFELFVLPAIRRMMGQVPHQRPTLQARLSADLTSLAGKRQYVRARFRIDADGAQVTPTSGFGSYLMGDLAESNALIVVPEDVDEVRAGSHMQVLVLDRDF